MARNDILKRENDIRKWIDAMKSKAFICRQLHCKPSTLEAYLQKFGIKYKGNQGNRGEHACTYKPASYYIENNLSIGSHKLKLKLLRDGVKDSCCEVCGLREWNGKSIPLELDHINGNHFDNTLDNLRVICPNCHAQTDTNSGKNVGKNIPS